MVQNYELNPGALGLKELHQLFSGSYKLVLAEAAWKKITASRQVIDKIIAEHKTAYGINTGFGLLAHTRIDEHDLATLQRRILLSHATGVGELLADEIVKLILLLKINTLARGYSGVRPLVIETLLRFYNEGIYPCIPAKGSVGASGDLAPLAHLSLPLIGEGCVRYQDKISPAAEVLKKLGIQPIALASKEGLALINGTQVSAGIALAHLFAAQKLFAAAATIGALSVDAAQGSVTPFNAKIHEVRGQLGQIKVAEFLRAQLKDSEILSSHQHCERVQDPYSLRCLPQVLGACLDNFAYVATILTREASAVSDNPLVFIEDDAVYSGGNFHAEPVAQVADLLAIALAEVGAFSERRIALLVDPHFNGSLPAFLTPNPGLNSGFMIAHVTAAALASANKSLAHPASIDSLPTSANQEDFVSMATHAAWRLKEMLENVCNILAIELLAACQGIDLRQPKLTAKPLQAIIKELRKSVAFWQEDRYFAPDIEAARVMVDKIGIQYRAYFFE
jgi:histidine ammonia-lyase